MRTVELDSDTEYYINFKRVGAKGKPVYFAGVSINKITVGFHLVPVSQCGGPQKLGAELRCKMP